MGKGSRNSTPLAARFFNPCFLPPLIALPNPNQRIVISTEAAHALVSSAVEKSASLPTPSPSPLRALASNYKRRTGSIQPAILKAEINTPAITGVFFLRRSLTAKSMSIRNQIRPMLTLALPLILAEVG